MLRHQLARGAGVAAVALCSLLAACGGGGGTFVSPTAAPTNSPTPSAVPTPASSQVTLTGAPQSVAIPAAGGISGSVSLPASTAANVAITATTSFAPPSGITALARRPMVNAVPTNAIPLFYETFTSPSAITFNGIPGFSIDLPATTNVNGAFYVGIFDTSANAWVQALGPATVSGTTITFAPQTGTPITLTANTAYTFGFYFVPNVQPTSSPTASPSSAPTASPTSLPTSSPTASPSPTNSALQVCVEAPGGSGGVQCGGAGSTLALNGTGSQNTGLVYVTGGTAPYTFNYYDLSTLSCATDTLNGGWDCTGVQAGSTPLKFTDASGNTIDVTLQITVTSGVIQ
ncbi:MAG TPA: hypothetical protein VFN49_04375 [Candidatus Aquilonibacter sp.]|nr:hypothetical protein [Candidatus Aquilonibacter sp.]